LRGKEQEVPETYTGVIFREQEQEGALSVSEEETTTRYWKVGGTFDRLTYWLREESPHDNDYMHQWLHWTQVAPAIHQQLTPEVMVLLLVHWIRISKNRFLSYLRSFLTEPTQLKKRLHENLQNHQTRKRQKEREIVTLQSYQLLKSLKNDKREE
jgi:hypothetical protein